MSNMSYCRFQNTLSDLRDCYSNWDNDDLSNEEERARSRILSLCEDIVSDWSEIFDLEEKD